MLFYSVSMYSSRVSGYFGCNSHTNTPRCLLVACLPASSAWHDWQRCLIGRINLISHVKGDTRRPKINNQRTTLSFWQPRYTRLCPQHPPSPVGRCSWSFLLLSAKCRQRCGASIWKKIGVLLRGRLLDKSTSVAANEMHSACGEKG